MKRFIKRTLLIALTVISAGCHPHGPYVKRESELNCPTDIRQTVPWCAGEDAVFRCPCGPNSEFYGYKPTCWGIWPAPAEQWRDSHCGPLVREEEYEYLGAPVEEIPVETSYPNDAPFEVTAPELQHEKELPKPNNLFAPPLPKVENGPVVKPQTDDHSSAKNNQPNLAVFHRPNTAAAKKIAAAMKQRAASHNDEQRSRKIIANLIVEAKFVEDVQPSNHSILQIAHYEPTGAAALAHYQKSMIQLNRHSYQR